MTEPISNEDQQWLDALAGHETSNLHLNTHAQVVRRALHQRRQEIEIDAALDRSEELARLLTRLQQEGLIRSESVPTKSWLQKLLAWLTLGSQAHGGSIGSSRALSRVIPVVVLLALAGSAIWLALQGRAPQVDERLIYRGDSNVVTLLVDDPEQRAKVLEAELKALPGAVTVQALKPTGWVLKVKDSNSVRDYLATQRIEGVAVNGQITLLVLPSKDIKH
jgi:hypothetical protein